MTTLHDLPPTQQPDEPGRWVWTPDPPRRRWLLRGAAAATVAVLGLTILTAGTAAIVYAVNHRTTQDPGVAYCDQIIANEKAGLPAIALADPAQYGLQDSASGHLRQAAAVFANLRGLTAQQRMEHLEDLVLAAGSVGAGCAEVGVPLPASVFAPS